MQYPLSVRFRLATLATQFTMREATGELVFYVKQKAFKLKEDINVCLDEEQQELYCTIKADRIIDFSASYTFATPDGVPFGGVRRKGLKSMWSAAYEVYVDDEQVMAINEEKPWKRLVESVLAEIPILGLIALYLICPTYLVTDMQGRELLRCRKLPAVFEGKFEIDQLVALDEDDENRALLGLTMMLLLERHRG